VITDATDAAQLRKLAIHTNYRGVLDISPLGGYGTLYGPNVKTDGTITNDEGMIAGNEYLAYADNRDGGPNVTLMVQVPATFDPKKPCIVHRRRQRIARHLRRNRLVRRMGAEARLCGRIYRQGYGHWRARSGQKHDQPDRW